MSKFKCKHCGGYTNMIILMSGERGSCLECLSDRIKGVCIK